MFAQKGVATQRNLTEEQRDELWHIIDARLWFLRLVARDVQSELDKFSADLDSELAR
jgi:hypothetical protein